jgi:hypothetical protein
MKNKKGLLFGVLGVLAGGVIAIGLQTHAAQLQNPVPSLTPQVQQAPTTTSGSDNKTVSDSKDTPETGTSVEASDTNLPGGWHADPSGNVNHQFEGEE